MPWLSRVADYTNMRHWPSRNGQLQRVLPDRRACPIAGPGRYIVRLYSDRKDNANSYGVRVTYQ
jgi:hypothetical protein